METANDSDVCVNAIGDFQDSAHTFATTFGGYVDNDPHVSVGDVVESAVSYGSDYVAMDTACE
ncbi:MAG: hypothetical protein U0X91_04365 [Spirosomataceae bacterium]